MRIKVLFCFLFIPFILHSQVDNSRFKFFLDNRILNENIDLNSKWAIVKQKNNFKKVFLSQKDKNDFFLDNFLNNYKSDSFFKHKFYFKSLNEKSKVIFGQKFDNLYLELETFPSFKFDYQPAGTINVHFHKKFNTVEDSKKFYTKIFKLIENITGKNLNKDAVVNNNNLNYYFLSNKDEIISLFNYKNSVLLDITVAFVDNSWPTEASYDEFSDNFKLLDEFVFFNAFRFNNNITDYLNVLERRMPKGGDEKDTKLYSIESNSYRKTIAGILFDEAYLQTKFNKIYLQNYFIQKSNTNQKYFDDNLYYFYLNKLINEFGYGLREYSKSDKISYLWIGKKVLINFVYDKIEENMTLIVQEKE